MIKITRAGFLYILLTIFLGISAINTGNNLIYLIVAALLSFMGISGFFGKNNLFRIEIDIEFPQEIYAKNEFPLKVTLRNKKRVLPVFLMKVHINGKDAFFPYVDPKGTETRYINISFPKRGRYIIDHIYVYSVFPFNFFTRYRSLEKTFECIVFPPLKECSLITLYEKNKRLKGDRTSDSIGYDTDIVSIREYVYGDPLKYINWKATAKTGKLKTKELSSLVYRPVFINFDEVLISDLEERISCVAYTVLKLIKANMPVGLRIKDKTLMPDVSYNHKINILKELALYEGS
ncbi:MAG: DUF58 domain-containing protein [Syntrophorhabdaceae bacterium]|nr:DUF58 domain-containing protein [Syntrophorhabdaceae bacterium]